ncbi:MAG: hypothetical protein WCT99_05335 [Bacteroidota bacterium]|jgi:hypothetical protein
MGVIIDIVSSFVVRAIIITIILNMMITLHDALHRNTQRAVLAETIASSCSVISNDVNLAGYGNPKYQTFDIGLQTQMRFRADLDNNGVTDIVTYRRSDMTGTSPRRYYIKRDVTSASGTTTLEIARNVVSFSIIYYSSNGAAFSYTPGSIIGVKSLVIKVTMESNTSTIGAYNTTSDNQLLQSSWQEHIFPKNLQ